jgi:hypothetical protein
MPSPNSTFTEMVSTTLRNHAREVVDNISDHNALLRAMKRRGNIKTEDGGYELAFPVEYANNATYQRYTGYDTLNINASDVISAARYDWAQIALHVTASGRELRQNNGREAMITLVKARIENAKHTASNNLSIDIYSDGALTNQINGLQALVNAAGTGTVGGIDSSSFSFWQNQFLEYSGTPGTANIGTMFNQLWLPCVRGTDKPDIIVLSHDYFAFYEGSLQSNQRYMKVDSAGLGFEELMYKTAQVIFDDNTNFGTTASRGYFLNTKYLYLVQHSQAQWTQDDDKKPINQDAVVVPLYWMGNMVVTNRNVQGVLVNLI